ncbi:MAG: hypothetical protein AAFY08_09990 [Planctomycetota bacterium]
MAHAAGSTDTIWGSYAAVMEEIHARKHRVIDTLGTAEVPYALIGGQAVIYWVGSRDPDATRTTKDTDILLRREDAERAGAALRAVGMHFDTSAGIPMFLDDDNPSPKRGVHIIWAGEVVREGDPLPAPDVDRRIEIQPGVFVVPILDLVGMKLTANRLHDQVHLVDMIHVGLIDRELLEQLPVKVAERLEPLFAEAERRGAH